jgi:hypothetical protein
MRKKHLSLPAGKAGSTITRQWSFTGKHFLLVFFFSFISIFLFNSPTYSQNVSASMDRDKILIGEQVELLLKVTDLDRSRQDIDKWFNLPDSFNHLEVVKRLPIDTSEAEGVYTYSQKILLTSFDSGYWQIPPVTISFTNKKSANTQPVNVSVLPVDVSNLKDYHDFKDIIEVNGETNWWRIGGIIIVIIALCIIVVLLIRYFKKRESVQLPPVKKIGVEEALRQIDALQKRELIAKQQHKLYFTELIHICRSFSDRQLNISSANKTSDEYMLLLKGKIGTEPAQISYFQLLRLADAVKFAKFIPGNSECEEAAVVAREFVKTIYQFQFQKGINAK